MSAPTNPRVFATFAEYLATVCASCPEPYPEGFAHYMAGGWLADGTFILKDTTTLPPRTVYPAFWDGWDKAKGAS